MAGYCQKTDIQEKYKRIVLLTICQYGTDHMPTITNDKIKKELGNAVIIGVRFWVAETKTETDGISLLPYQNITDSVLDS